MTAIKQYAIEGFYEIKRAMENNDLSDSEKLNVVLHNYHMLADQCRWLMARNDSIKEDNKKLRKKLKSG